jgi:GNAT superfamily N-acetyltransferase
MPLTATSSLAARIDRAEAAMVRGIAEAVARSGRPVQTWPLGGGWAVLGEPGSPFNKLIGLGFDGLPDAAELDAIERAHAAAAAPLQVELSTLANPGVGTLLTGRGYRLMGFEHVLARRLGLVEAVASEVALDPIRPDESSLWIRTLTDAFLAPDVFDGPPSHESFDRAALERAYQDSAEVPGMLRLLARMGGAVAGGASVYQHEGTALLCGAATLPASRRRGVQSSLLRVRLAHATAAGCDLAVVTTQPGSKSQENVQRAGFELVYSRAVLVKEPATGNGAAGNRQRGSRQPAAGNRQPATGIGDETGERAPTASP